MRAHEMPNLPRLPCQSVGSKIDAANSMPLFATDFSNSLDFKILNSDFLFLDNPIILAKIHCRLIPSWLTHQC